MQDCNPGEWNQQSVTVITVTYGEREHLLCKMIDACLYNGVTNYIVVDNGATWDVEKIAHKFPDCSFQFEHLENNAGPAVGYCKGIEGSLIVGHELIWLLDDDLCPEAGCLSELLYHYNCLFPTYSKERLAVLATRPTYQSSIVIGRKKIKTPLNLSASAFFEFSLGDVPQKIKRRLHEYLIRHGKKIKSTPAMPDIISVDRGPYGGLLFHRGVIDLVGLPNKEFILYVDDYDFTQRLTDTGGSIYLITSAKLKDIDPRAVAIEKRQTSFKMWLFEADYRIFYAARNLSYFENNISKGSIMYSINKILYLSLLLVGAIRYGRIKRFLMIKQAIVQGRNGKLGVSQEHFLP
jgi:GT2 family glycosyltransferase